MQEDSKGLDFGKVVQVGLNICGEEVGFSFSSAVTLPETLTVIRYLYYMYSDPKPQGPKKKKKKRFGRKRKRHIKAVYHSC